MPFSYWLEYFVDCRSFPKFYVLNLCCFLSELWFTIILSLESHQFDELRQTAKLWRIFQFCKGLGKKRIRRILFVKIQLNLILDCLRELSEFVKTRSWRIILNFIFVLVRLSLRDQGHFGRRIDITRTHETPMRPHRVFLIDSFPVVLRDRKELDLLIVFLFALCRQPLYFWLRLFNIYLCVDESFLVSSRPGGKITILNIDLDFAIVVFFEIFW